MRSEHEPQRTPLGPVTLADWATYAAANDRARAAYHAATKCTGCGGFVALHIIWSETRTATRRVCECGRSAKESTR